MIKAGKNKAAKLARHLKKHPGDAQAASAVKDARAYTGRTAPKRMGARVNPFVGERDQMALAEQLIELKQATREACIVKSRSLNLLNGRISALGRRVQEGARKARAALNEAQFDRKGKLFAKPKMTKAERDQAKARAMAKADKTAPKRSTKPTGLRRPQLKAKA
jgi:hypothetical protein